MIWGAASRVTSLRTSAATRTAAPSTVTRAALPRSPSHPASAAPITSRANSPSDTVVRASPATRRPRPASQTPRPPLAIVRPTRTAVRPPTPSQDQATARKMTAATSRHRAPTPRRIRGTERGREPAPLGGPGDGCGVRRHRRWLDDRGGRLCAQPGEQVVGGPQGLQQLGRERTAEDEPASWTRRDLHGEPGATVRAHEGIGVAGRRAEGRRRHADQRGSPAGVTDERGYSDPARVRLGAPGRIRTCDLEIRRLLLYPAELQGLGGDHCDAWGVRVPQPGVEYASPHGMDRPAGGR